MRKKLHEINGVPPEDQNRTTPEYVPLPDEYNRFAPVAAEEEKKPSRIRKIMLILAAAGLATLGIFWPNKILPNQPVNPDTTATAPSATEVIPSVTPSVKEPTPQPNETPTPAPNLTPTPSPTPEPTPIVLTGKIHVVIYSDIFDMSIAMEGAYPSTVLADEMLDAEGFTSYPLPALPTQDGYTALGYVLLAGSGQAYFESLYYQGEQPHAIGSVALGDELTINEVAIVPLNDECVREAEIHVAWIQEDSDFVVEFYDGEKLFNKSFAGFPLYSDGLLYLAAFPTPVKEGLTFNGWVNDIGVKVDALTYFDFYQALPDAQTLEDRNLNIPIPCRLYATWMDAFGNELEPEIPLPDCKLIYYQTHSVSNAIILLTDRLHTTGVHVRIWAEQVQDAVLDYELTESEISRGMWEESAIDLNEFYGKHMAEYEALDTFIPPVMEVTLTYRLNNGTTGTVKHTAEVKPEEYVSVEYHDDDLEANAYTFPGCFVASVFDTENADLTFVDDPNQRLQNGEICVSVKIGYRRIPAENCHVVRLEDTWEYEGKTYTHYAYYYVISRPEDFPEHGTATVSIHQRFLNFDFETEKQFDIEY